MQPQELPPPDVPPPDAPPVLASPAPPEPRGRNIALPGVLLVLVGLLLLARELFVFNIGAVLLLVIGLAFLLAYFFVRRTAGFLIPGGILAGLGLGVLLQAAAPRAQDGGVVLVCLALGFAIIWVFERRHVWAVITGAILAAIGVYDLTNELTVAREIARWWPVILIAVGVWVLFRRMQRTDGRTG